MSSQERRFFSKGTLRANKFASGGQMRVDGNIPYGSITKINTPRGFFHETLDRCFRSTIAKNTDVRVLYNHNADMGVLGRVKSGTVRLQESERGLSFQLELPQSPLGQTIYESCSRADLDGVSFGFSVPDGGDTWNESWVCSGSDGDGCEKNTKSPLRTITDLDLQELSLVVWPAYKSSSAKSRIVEDLSADPTDPTDDDDDDVTEYSGAVIVSEEVRSRVAACRKPRLSDAAWLEQAARRMVAADLAIRAESTRYLVSDVVDDLGLQSQPAAQAARDAAFEADLRETRKNAARLRNPSAHFPTFEEYYEWHRSFFGRA